jgi:two-component system KDP operon response regulator KdpE
MVHKILVVDDNHHLLESLRDCLEEEGYHAVTASDGHEAMRSFYAERPDLVLLDVTMPKLDGWQVCQRIREMSDLPIVMLTANGEKEAIVRGLDMGADDYVVKPFVLEVLLARVRAALRRTGSEADVSENGAYSDDHLSIDLIGRRVVVDSQVVRLTPTEYKLLALLVENRGRVLPFDQILEAVWGPDYASETDYVRTYIWHLRRKIEPDPKDPRYLQNELEVGYRFQPQE